MADPPPDDLESLRRRVYGPSARAGDVDRYRAALATREDAVERVEPAVVAGPNRRVVLIAAGAGAAVAAIGAAALWPRTAAAPPLPITPLPAAAGAGFVRSLRAGHPAGIAAVLRTRRGRVVGTPRSTPVEGTGSGGGGMALNPSALPPGPGRATVLIVVDAAATVRWRVDGLGAIAGGAVTLHALRRGAGSLPAGALATDGFGYRDADRPARFRIELPAGTRWGAAVLFTA